MWSCLKSSVPIQTALVCCVVVVRLVQGEVKDFIAFLARQQHMSIGAMFGPHRDLCAQPWG